MYSRKEVRIPTKNPEVIGGIVLLTLRYCY